MNSSDDINLFTGLNDHKSFSTLVQKSILATVAILAVFLACFFGVDWTRVEVQPSLSPVSHKTDLNRLQLPGEASYPAKKIESLPIRDIRVGTRVPARNPQVSDLERANFTTEVDPSTWRTFSFQLEKDDGSLLDIVMLRPSQWLAEELALVEEDDSIGALDDRPLNSTESGNVEPTLTNTVSDDIRRYCAAEKAVLDIASLVEQLQSGGAIGSEIYFDLPELGAVGFATLLSNEPASHTTNGPGSIVTATFRHEAASILDLCFSPVTASSNSSELTLGVTDTHPFWSIDRKDFVAAGNLRLYETVTALNGGEFRLTNVQRKPASETVFNFEVADEHVYYVGDEGILVHNSCGKKTFRISLSGFRNGNAASPLKQAARVVRTGKGAPVKALTQSEQAAMRKIANIESGHLKPHGYTGTLRDMVGNPVPKKTGGYWDHAQEMNNSLQGLRKHVNTLRNSTDPAAVSARERAEALIKKIVEFTEGAGL